MVRLLRSRGAWRLAAVLVLMLALMVSMMPTAAYAHDDGCAAHYKVKPGDNLTKIASWYGVSVHALVKANHISNPSRIYVGQKLCIPAGGKWHGDDHGKKKDDHHYGGCWYTVKKGDNLSQIAKWYGVPWPDLARINHLSNPRVVIPGQRLYVCK
jgi:LysM repeat protein